MNGSYWDLQILPQRFDVAIIGSGIVGLSTAIHLKMKHPEYEIAVLERGLIPAGASTKNAGFACFGSLSEIVDDLEKMGSDAVIELIRDRWTGLNFLLEITAGYDIGYQNNGGFELFRDEDEALYKRCIEQLDPINALLKSHFEQTVFSPVDDRISTFGFSGVRHLLINPFEGQLHPGLMIKAMMDRCRKSGIHLLHGADVNGWEETDQGVQVQLNNWHEIKCEKLVICTNGFARELVPQLSVKPTRAQVLLTDPIPGLKWKGTFHIDRGFYYFRNIENRILLGGARNLNIAGEFTSSQQTSIDIQSELERTLREVILPNQSFQIAMRWAGTMGTGPSKQPIVQLISDRVAVAVRMAGMGIAIGSRMGEKAARLITE